MSASVTIRYEVDPETGERTIVVSYQSEPDALPMEHEEEHRELVEKLVEGGLIGAAEAGEVRIEREGAGTAPVELPGADEAQTEGQTVEEGS